MFILIVRKHLNFLKFDSIYVYVYSNFSKYHCTLLYTYKCTTVWENHIIAGFSRFIADESKALKVFLMPYLYVHIISKRTFVFFKF